MRTTLALLAALTTAVPAQAADLSLDGSPALDFEGRARGPGYGRGLAAAPCPAPRRDGAPATITNAPWDSTYVGSAYGLGKPSRDGFVPPLGDDDPNDRLVRACR